MGESSLHGSGMRDRRAAARGVGCSAPVDHIRDAAPEVVDDTIEHCASLQRARAL